MGKTKIKPVEQLAEEEVKTPEVYVEGKIAEQPNEKAAKKVKKSKSSKKERKQRSKKYQEVLEKMEKSQKVPALEGVKIAQTNSYSKFEGTIEAHINTNAKNLRGLLNMPFAKGKKLIILAFGADAAKSGADLVGSDETISAIDKGKLDFDIVITSPDWMPKLARVAKILGPRGLMPNPKNGTISNNLEKTVIDLQGGKTEYKTEANGQVIHLAVGKVSQKPEEIVANLKVVYNTIGRSKIQKISLSPTMGPSVKVDLSTLN
jgi:large subunit ribosomal protein L1